MQRDIVHLTRKIWEIHSTRKSKQNIKCSILSLLLQLAVAQGTFLFALSAQKGIDGRGCKIV